MKRDQASVSTDKQTLDSGRVGVALGGQSTSREYEVREVVLGTSSAVCDVPAEIQGLFAQDYIIKKLQKIFSICVAREVLIPEELMVASALLQDLAEEIFALGYDMAEGGKDSGDEIVAFACRVRQDAQSIWLYTQEAMYRQIGYSSTESEFLRDERRDNNPGKAPVRRINELVLAYKNPIRLYIEFFSS